MLLQDTVRIQAASQPDAIAVVSGDRRLSYGQLEAQSNQLARVLQQHGCLPGDRVGLLVPKSAEALLGMLGILKAGGIYVPLDTHSPATRLRRMIDCCQPRCLLADGDGLNVLPELLGDDIEPLTFPALWHEMQARSEAPLDALVADDAPAHILFTSGSTGVPKGVVISHANVLHFLNWAIGYFGTTNTDRISLHPPLHFDLSTFDIYGTFLGGAELHLVPPEANLLPHKLAQFIRESRLTQWFSVPSALKFMAQFDCIPKGAFPDLKRVLWCGEALPTPTLMYWMQRLPDVQFTNLYGPTETTIASSYYTVPECPGTATAPIPIGRPCAGEELVVLDESLRPVPENQVGELYIRGVGLSSGYWRDANKTQAAFVMDETGTRSYRTGDLARAGSDGLVYLLGRSDSQIKSRGYRIELGEIESALHALGTIRQCAVVAIPSSDFEGNTICCAYVGEAGAPQDGADLRQQLAAMVPQYMLPAKWMRCASLPLNSNGKVDRPLLREQFQMMLSHDEAPPRRNRVPTTC